MKTHASQAVDRGFASAGGVRRRSDEDQPLAVQEGWIRGRAFIGNDKIILAPEGRSVYHPEIPDPQEGMDLALLHFVNLYPDMEEPQPIIEFVEKYGLLTEEGLRDSSELLHLWPLAYRKVSRAFQFHWDIQRAKGDELRSFNELAKIADAKYIEANDNVRTGNELIVDGKSVDRAYIYLYDQGAVGSRHDEFFSLNQKTQLLRLAMNNLADYLQPYLEGCLLNLSCDPLIISKDSSSLLRHAMKLDFRAPDLYHYFFLRIAVLAVDNTPIGLCRCGNYYPLTREDRAYCSPACSGTERSKNSRERLGRKSQSQGT